MDHPEQVVQRQLDAYNAKDLDSWIGTYAPDAEQYELHGALLARGHDEIRGRIRARFTEPDLHARLIHRTRLGPIVVDHERITRNFPEGKGTIEMLCIYEVDGGLIRKASFHVGSPVLLAPAVETLE
ncbi:nuclear transport factor 2 family protein [Solimonas marina]|uniref:SnoaL-like domain-containing protein n=1 Tax=Solimonas marina TaxID=2714601 RepID=A0A970B921_9GAMM|nr:nuclear transport factor 2 family protein [Solimonas marina]NKF21981.1 SnoaL-like domain-containing protein [Solimonas marina]